MGDQLSGRMAEERAIAVRAAGEGGRFSAVACRYPVLFVVLFLVLGLLALNIGGDMFQTPAAAQIVDQLWSAAAAELVAVVVVIGLAVALGWWRAVGFTGVGEWRSLRLLWFPVLMYVVIAVPELAPAGMRADAGSAAAAGVSNLLVGFFEEALFRGLILFLLLHAWRHAAHGVLWAVLTSSVLFALAHLGNVVHQPTSTTFTQVTYALCIGVGLSGLALRTNTLWIGVVWHAMIDWTSDITTTPGAAVPSVSLTSALLTIAPTLPMLVVGLYLIRHRRQTPALAAHPERQHKR